MDSSSPESSKIEKGNFPEGLIRCSFTLVFLAFITFFMSYAAVFLAFFLDNLSISPTISVRSQCKIISSSIDLRSSKICELGLLNYKAKHVFYPSERRKFRCRYDYYWASIFEVEYKDRFSGQILVGQAEAPNEALPSNCRPNFSTAWLTMHLLNVNGTYDCWYTSGRSKVEILQDRFFGCQAKEPSTYEMMRRYYIISTRMMNSWLSGQLKTKSVGWEMVAGAVGGFFAGLVSFVMFAICQRLITTSIRVVAAKVASLTRRLILTRIFFLVVYFSIIGWVAIQYAKRLGLTKLFAEILM